MTPLEGEDDLLLPFARAFRPDARLVGLEAERLGVFPDGRPLRYHGPLGVRELFDELARHHRWSLVRETDGAPPIAMERGRSSITLEPGSQLELSSAPHEDVHALAAEVRCFEQEITSTATLRRVTWLGLGFHPFARQEDLDWVPKGRYGVMRGYFPSRGAHGLDMMRRTATVQVNLDFASERDAMRKLRVALAASPVVTALFANSAVVEGRRLDVKSHRARVWLDVDPDRTGLLPFAWSPQATLGDYVRWALHAPMFIVKRGHDVHPATHLTFARYLREGLGDLRASMEDWDLHLGTLFPEARLRRTIEMRGADSVPFRFAMALPALWVGLLYDPVALDAAEALVVPFGHDAWAAARPEVAVRGLAATVGGVPLARLAPELLTIAAGGLARRARLDAAGHDESAHLAPLQELAASGRPVGDVVLGDWSPAQPDALAALLERARY